MAEEMQTYGQTNESVVIYQSADNAVRLDVQLAEETVWLSQKQMAQLFDTTPQNITLHIGNVYKEQELTQSATCKDFLQVQIEGGKEKRRLTKFYNLDVIISVGYRVKSRRGTQFRQWATKVLNQYIRQGYAVSNRFEKLEQRMTNVENQIESFVHAALPPKEGIFADGQIHDAYEFIERLIKSAKKSILLIDNYVDESVLTMLSGKNKGVQVDIYTKELSNALLLAQDKFNSQYGNLSLHQTNRVHDRFMIIDNQTIYLIGASLKDAGKRLFAFTKMSATHIEELKKLL
jgi:hypothetical protein